VLLTDLKPVSEARETSLLDLEQSDSVRFEFRGRYDWHDGKTVTISAVTFFRLQANRVKHGHVFYDPTPMCA